MTFAGFTSEAFQFLLDIKFHNNRDWFEQNREVYVRALQQPCLALAQALVPTMLAIDPRYDPRPQRIVARIHRDVRYSHGIPYKDYVFLSFKPAGAMNSQVLSCYFYLQYNAWGYGTGFYAPVRPAMEAFRARLLREGEAFRAALSQPGMERFQLSGESYKKRRAPASLDEALAAWYDKKSFYLECSHPVDDLVRSPALVDELTEGFGLLAPIVRFIVPPAL